MKAGEAPRITLGRHGKIAAISVVIVLASSFVASGTWAAFSATTDNTGNSFQAGTVTLSDNDLGSAMLGLSNAKPGDSDTSCIQVNYTGSLSATVRLYGTTTGTGLDQYLNLTVTRGTSAAGFDNCTGFAADSTDYLGSGAGVIYSGTLQGYPDSYATAIVDPTTATPETWTTSESHIYRFTISVQDNDLAEGLTATQAFTWEARS